MKKSLLILSAFIAVHAPAQSTHAIKVSHASQYEDFIEIGIEMDKPMSKFELIGLDTMTVASPRNSVLKENKDYPLNYNYNNGRGFVRRYNIPDKKVKTVHITGIISYFTPSEANGSYIDLGTLKNIQRNTNLVGKKISEKNQDLYFSIINAEMFHKVFPDFKYKSDADKDYRKPDFESFDIMYAYRYNNKQKLLFFINDDPDPGYNNLSVRDKKTGIIYKLVRLKKNMPQSERDQIKVELMIENEKSVRKIPFELKDVAIQSK
ncbi:MAG: hypothetical protein LBE92_17325 [Chryseobacterium sp.]|jgi:hypothetical protein|uniref:hypothetical protein n=1 Tax=Chryseobacterium sp. TaxID=1871047 RepID=UPI00282D0F23|nr:hypothetical protein [Chryseobacterium sp.]MDR2237888.1 hypothetical protein [Chryseobacterium sp.]